MRKGFVLVETIVVITVLATSLLMIYNTFNSVLVMEKERMYYDDPIYLYRTFYILNLFQRNHIINYLDQTLKENKDNNYPILVEVSCSNTLIFSPGSGSKLLCEQLMATDYMDIKHIYFTYQDVSHLVCKNDAGSRCQRNESLRGVSTDAVNYLKSLDGYNKDGYRIVIEFSKTIKNKEVYFYASLIVPDGEV